MVNSPSYSMEEMEGVCLLVCGGGFRGSTKHFQEGS